MLTISTTGTYQAETIFFEILRQINPCFFAVDFENRNYGWLNPVKHV
ncbi:sporulation inhibitor of replication protein SirA [Anaerobacillus sp. HL2]|nr:sporulation inhibitor of replication protein SirA [Anaerobacillus sp. HL2]